MHRNRFDPPGPKPWLMLIVALVFLGFLIEFADVLSVRKAAGGPPRDPEPAAAAAEPLRATASLPPVAGLVRALGGGRWQVDSLLGPGQDPHVYEPTPRQVAALAASRFFFRTSMPFEDALAARAAAKHPGLAVVALASGEEAGEPALGHVHAPGESAVHGWLSPHNLEVWAHAVADGLETAEPARREEILRNLAAWIDALDAEETATRAAAAASGVRAFAAWHPSYGAWAADFGLEQIALEADGKAPGPQTLAAARERVAAAGAKTMLVQNDAEKARAAEFAASLGLRLAVVPPLGDDPLATLRALRESVLAP